MVPGSVSCPGFKKEVVPGSVSCYGFRKYVVPGSVSCSEFMKNSSAPSPYMYQPCIGRMFPSFSNSKAYVTILFTGALKIHVENKRFVYV